MVISGYECVTVAELIEHLSSLPGDAPVVFRYCSDYAALTLKEVDLHLAEDKSMVYRGGRIMGTYPEKQWEDEKPEFVTVVVFPGN